jgi:hypothetical protein
VRDVPSRYMVRAVALAEVTATTSTATALT